MSAVRRAVLDPSVVAEWARRRAEYRRKARPAWYVFATLTVVAVLPPILQLVPPWPYYAVISVLCIASAIHLHLRHQVVLSCPHCGKRPTPQFGRLPLYEIDCCPHCYYWLLDPRRGAADI